jgi:hypothetical protein
MPRFFDLGGIYIEKESNMRLKYSVLLTLLIAASGPMVAGRQLHAGFSFNGVQPSNGDILSFKLTNFEAVLDKAAIDNLVPALAAGAKPTGAQVLATKQAGGLVDNEGDQLFGILKITSIENLTTGDQAWHSSPTQELAGVFWGYTLKTVPTFLSSTTFSPAEFTGGRIQIFFDATPDFNANTGPFRAGWTSESASNGVGNAGDTLFLDLDGVAGISADPSVTLKSSFTALSLSRVTGVGDGFLTVTYSSDIPFAPDGLDGATVGGTYAGNQTLSLKSNFDSHTVTGVAYETTTSNIQGRGWSLKSEDPVNGVFVPEPSSLLIFGIGGLTTAFAQIRRRRSLV